MKSVLLAAVFGAAMVAPAFAADPICDPLNRMIAAAREATPFASLDAAPPAFEGAVAPCAKMTGEKAGNAWRCQLLEFNMNMNEKSEQDKAAFTGQSQQLTQQAMAIAAQVNECLGETWTSDDEPPAQQNGVDKAGIPVVYSSQGILWTAPDGVAVRMGLGAAVGGGHASRWTSLIVLKP